MTLPHARMRMHNPLFCLKNQVVGFIHDRFIYKLIRMAVNVTQTKAELLITKNSWFMIALNVFLYFIVPLQCCGLWFTKSNWITLFLSLLGTF